VVIVPANIGSDGSSSRAVMATGRKNRGIRSRFMLFGFVLIVVEMKFIVPRIDDKEGSSIVQ
jgi:hypothetical protein